jgi:hypothetical protein
VNPVDAILKAVRQALTGINPIPEPLQVVLGSRWFWLAVWLGVFAAIGRALLGRVGGWLGLALGAYLWVGLVPNGSSEIALIVLAVIVVRGLMWWWPRTGLGRRSGGLKRCPDCAEDVKLEARVCKHCGYRFEPVKS